jgi:hypothetical protein
VEERPFGGVIERFEGDVKTMQFRNIKVTPESIKTVESGMTRASRFVHEDAYAAQVPLPSINDMADDVEALRASSGTPALTGSDPKNPAKLWRGLGAAVLPWLRCIRTTATSKRRTTFCWLAEVAV